MENEARKWANMMWSKPPLTIADNCAVDVRSVAAAREWYKEKLGLREAQNDREEDSGRPFVDLHISDDDTFLSLVELESRIENARIGVVAYGRGATMK